jgi:flavorubredoxin
MTFDITTNEVARDIDVLTTNFPIPGLGFVPINAFVLHGSEPILVDTGAGVTSEQFMSALRSVIDPGELAWIWLTHPDPDHTGALGQLLQDNPNLRVATTFLGVGMMSLFAPLPMDRVFLINPGQTLEAGKRTLHALRPPAFDNPSTLGFFESKSRALFTSDCFGALLDAVPEDAGDLSEDELRQGQTRWATIDTPWLHKVEGVTLAGDLDRIRNTEPTLVLSSHLPPASGAMLERMLSTLGNVGQAEPFVGPDQAALMAMMAGG